MTEYGLAGQPKPEEDTFYPVVFGDTGETYNFSDRWDRVCVWREVGAFCLKVIGDEGELVEAWLPEEEAMRLIEHTGTEPHYRENMTPSEKEGFRRSKEV
jgi:hypothetical protein